MSCSCCRLELASRSDIVAEGLSYQEENSRLDRLMEGGKLHRWGFSPRDGSDLANTCCHLEGCLRTHQQGKGSYTALTVLSSNKYLPLVQVRCS